MDARLFIHYVFNTLLVFVHLTMAAGSSPLGVVVGAPLSVGFIILMYCIVAPVILGICYEAKRLRKASQQCVENVNQTKPTGGWKK